ncbi:MAG: N-acetylmuramoyl-L-alanine amidase [Clostridia bacterium]|nr:N-acetylmuramoyl-L-alanine amidase [Clostridia bacterium]
MLRSKAGLKIASLILSASLIIGGISSSLITLARNSTPTAIEAREFPVIVVDAGHGGIDGGAVAADGTAEKGINLAIAKYLNEILSLAGFNTVMTRNSDDLISDEGAVTIRQKKSTDLKNRAKLLDSYDDAILISIHQNKFSQAKYWGAQVFYSPNAKESEALAERVQSSIATSLQADNKRKIKKSGSEIYLLHTAKHPAIMVECGFLSNSNELSKLKDSKYQSEIAFSIFCGIIEYIKDESRESG